MRGDSPSAILALMKATRALLRGAEAAEPECSRVESGVLW